MLFDQYKIYYNPLSHRLRCNGHIINLAAQAFLFHTEDEALAEENNTKLLSLPTEVEMARWRKKGPLGRLHNIVVHIQRSPQRIARFQELSGGRNLARDNSTRWNSWYKMISTATILKTPVNLYCHQYKENDRDLLSEQDWIELQKLQDFLLSFHHATLSTEARGDTIDKVLLSMDFLLEQFEDAKRVYAEDPFMGPCCNSGWAKLDKYYTLTERSPVYIAALVLCPQWKWDYIESSWPKEWHADCKAKMQEFWKSEYKSTAVSVPTQASQATESANPGVSNAFTQYIQRKQQTGLESDEYAKYLQAPTLLEVRDPRSWWLEPTQRLTYPNLSRMALDMLSIPAMSAEPERLFSACKITLTDRRNQLGIESIQAIECCKSWLCRGSIPYVDDLEVPSDLSIINRSVSLQPH